MSDVTRKRKEGQVRVALAGEVMSAVLFNDPPLVVSPSIACLIGLNESILLQQVHYWLNNARKANDESKFKDGRWWTYNSAKDWQKNDFPFWSVTTIRRIIASLEKRGLLVRREEANRKVKGGSRVWFTIDYIQVGNTGISKLDIQSIQFGNTFTENTTETPSDKKEPTDTPSGDPLSGGEVQTPIVSETETIFGFEAGQTVYWVEEPPNSPAVIHECTVLRRTAKKVWIRNGAGEKCLYPRNIHAQRPELKRKTNPLQDVYLECSYGIGPDAPIGKGLMTNANTLKGMLTVSWPQVTPELLRAIFAQTQHTPSRPESVIAMVKRHFDQQKSGAFNGTTNRTAQRASRAPDDRGGPGESRQSPAATPTPYRFPDRERPAPVQPRPDDTHDAADSGRRLPDV